MLNHVGGRLSPLDADAHVAPRVKGGVVEAVSEGLRRPGPARVLVVDDHQMVREGLRAMLQRCPSIEVVGLAQDAAGALDAMEALHPDAVLLDAELGRDNGLEAAADIRRRWSSTKIIILTTRDDEMHIFEAMRAGADGYLLKGIRAEPLMQAIEDVCDGKTVLDPALGGSLALRAAHRGRPRSWAGAGMGLTRRESEVLEEMAAGRDNASIASALYITEETVKTHVKSIFRKLGVHDRAHAVVIALRHGVSR